MSYWADAAMRMPSANRECATCHIMWLTEFKREDITTLIAYDPTPVTATGKEDVASTDPMCFSCHDGFVLESRYLWEQGKHAHPVGQKPSDKIHIPKVDGKNLFPLNEDGKVYCGTCHTAHGVDWGQEKAAVFMRVRNENGKLCMACHQDRTKGPKHGSHPVNKKIQELLDGPPEKLMAAGGLFGENGDVVCQSCHKAHAAPEEKILLVKNDASQLCGECHIHRYARGAAAAGRLGTHPVNVKPVHLKVPAELLEQGAKLGDAGEVICETCHRPHNALPDTGLMVTANNKDSLCQACHQDKQQVVNSKHDMSLVEADSQNIRKQVAGDSGPCSACHVPHKGTAPKMWARSVDEDVDPMASLCLSCHSKEGIASKHTVGDYSHPVGVDISRLGHSVELPTFGKEGIKTVNVMQGAVSCASCHDPHQWDPNNPDFKGQAGKEGNNRNRFLRIANGSDAALCRECHDNKWKVAGSKHDMRYMAPKAKNTLNQTVAQSGICGSCHLVHNANAPGLWARSNLDGQGLGYVACIGCHNKDGLAGDKILGDHSHPVHVEIEKLGIKAGPKGWSSIRQADSSEIQKENNSGLQKLKLYDKQGNPVNSGGNVGCGSCHDPHNWSILSYKPAKHPRDMEGDANTSFLKIADQGQSRLCINCHVDKKSVFYTRHDLTESAAGNKLTTGADKPKDGSVAGVCTHCHQAHNAKGPALWARDKGAGDTAIAPLCNDCHQRGGLAKDKLTGKHSHPLGVAITGVRHGENLPLFDSQGRRVKTGGKVDCSSCHNPHRWDPTTLQNRSLNLVAEDGDASNSFLRLPANRESLLCVTCHEEKKTILGTDHDMATTAPDARNIQDQDRDKAGICSQCHVPHKAEDRLYLWARKLGDGNDAIEKRCRSCHSEHQFAAGKNPTMVKHPEDIKIWSPELRQQIYNQQVPYMPAYDEQGIKSAFGAITCASCHNPHQWDPDVAKSGPGHNQEGDANTSYLRTGNTAKIVCADCHGKDSLFRYKYFHSESAHKKHHMFR